MPSNPDPSHASLALSGGGLRASAFSLGAMLYLVDSGANRYFDSIASVSGGSITNGLTAKNLNFNSECRTEFETKVAAKLARRISGKGLSFSANGRAKLYLMALIAGAGVCLGLGCAHGLLGLLALFAYLSTIIAARGRVQSSIFADTLFGNTQLATLTRPVTHVFCATELQTGRHLYFSPRFVSGWLLGRGLPKNLAVADVVQYSAAYPFGYPARKLNPEDLGLSSEEDLWVSDGGIYDNMAEQFATGFSNRVKRDGELPGVFQPDFLLAVNSSALGGWKAFKYWSILKEVGLWTRSINILYDNTTAQRRSSLIQKFDSARQGGPGMGGALIHIGTSPSDLLNYWRKTKEPSIKERAKALHNDPTWPAEGWEAITAGNIKVATTLSALGNETTTNLIWHAYCLTRATTYLLHGWKQPTDTLRTREDIAKLCEPLSK